jgi:alkylation response protein AidB-like acyl-CoA dehydrogenase
MSLTIDERDALRSSVRGLLGRESSSAHVRQTIDRDQDWDADLWAKMGDLGWTTIHVGEQVGGAGYGYADVAVVLHELGRSLTVSPFVASAVLTQGVLRLADNRSVAEELATAISRGDLLGTVALASRGGSYQLDQSTTTWQWSDGLVRLDGTAGFVLDADLAGVIVVGARDRHGVPAVVAVDVATPGLQIRRTATVDGTRRLFEVTFDALAVNADRLLCEPGPAAGDLIDRVVALGAVAAACDAAGAAEMALESAVAYAIERNQFGKPIGSFQAIKHHCANMAIAVETSRAATRVATERLDEGSDWTTAAAIAASYVGPACARVCELALLVHGGIGFTWEADSHLLLKRVKLDESLFGSPAWHRRRLASVVLPRADELLSTPTHTGGPR